MNDEQVSIDELFDLFTRTFIGIVDGRAAAQEAVRISGRIGDYHFLAKAAVFARIVLGLPTVSRAMAVSIVARDDVRASFSPHAPWKSVVDTRGMFAGISPTPMDVCETLDYQIKKIGKPIPNSMKRGLGDSLSSFSEDDLASYVDSCGVHLVDAVNLCHPTHTEAIGRLVRGQIRRVSGSRVADERPVFRGTWTNATMYELIDCFPIGCDDSVLGKYFDEYGIAPAVAAIGAR